MVSLVVIRFPSKALLIYYGRFVTFDGKNLDLRPPLQDAQSENRTFLKESRDLFRWGCVALGISETMTQNPVRLVLIISLFA